MTDILGYIGGDRGCEPPRPGGWRGFVISQPTIVCLKFSPKNDFFSDPPFSFSKRRCQKKFPENFQILFTLLKNNFQFYFFCFINESPKKIFQKIFKNYQTPYRNERSKNYRKKLKIVFLLIFISCNVAQNYHNGEPI